MGLFDRNMENRIRRRIKRRNARAERKGRLDKMLTKTEIEEEVKKRVKNKEERREAIKKVSRGVGKVIAPVLHVGMAVIPGGNAIGAALDAGIDKLSERIPIAANLKKVPIIKEAAAIGGSFIQEEIKNGGSTKTAIIKDIFEVFIKTVEIIKGLVERD